MKPSACLDCGQPFSSFALISGPTRKRCPECAREHTNAVRRKRHKARRANGERLWDCGHDIPAAQIRHIIDAALAEIRWRRNRESAA